MILRKTIAMLCAGVMLAACAETPDNVKSGAENSRAESLTSVSSALESAAVSISGDAAETIKNTKYDNIKFADTFTVNAGEADDLGIYEAERRTDLSAYADGIFEAYFGADYDKAKTVSKEYDTPGGKEPDLSFEQGGTELHVGSRYLYFTNRNEAKKNLTYSSGDKLAALFEAGDAFKDERITLAEGNASVGELAGKLEGFIEKLRTAGAGDFRLFTVASLTNENTGRTLPTTLLTYRKYFRGLPIFNFAYSADIDETDALNYMLIESDAVSFASPDSIFSGGFSSSYNETKKVASADSIITPEMAVETASRELAQYLDLTALRLDLVYVPIVAEGAKDNSKVTFYPYWQLAFGLQPLAEHYALINAVSGEVVYYEPKGE
ncbi:MAG: hypothetical protein IKN66_03080 [Ruminococcus sp.]|nr:hypothetical protein [Ruminococcus sp.]